MANRPIIFSASMVRALLSGAKTQTRRILKPQPETYTPRGWRWDAKRGSFRGAMGSDIETFPEVAASHAPYAVGDRLWVRENWQRTEAYQGFAVSYAADDSVHALLYRDPSDPFGTAYGVGEKLHDVHDGPWKPSIHMPRWASRLTLVVEQVRVERLQDISEADARAEGVTADDDPFWRPSSSDPDSGGNPSHRNSFEYLWDSIHGADAWAENPWAVAISFAVNRCNIDALSKAKEC